MEETSAIQCSLFVFHFSLSNPRLIFSFYLVLGTNISLPAKISLAYLTYRVSSPMVPKFSASILSSVPGGKLHETVVPRSHASNYRSQTCWLFTVPDWTQTLSLRPYLNPWGALQPSVLPLWLESCDTLALYDPRRCTLSAGLPKRKFLWHPSLALFRLQSILTPSKTRMESPGPAYLW